MADQLFGDPSRHKEVRKATVEYVLAHKDDFLAFICLDGGDHVSKRRSAKRKNFDASTSSSSSCSSPNPDDIVARQVALLEKQMAKMVKVGEWADHLEIAAFAARYQRRVKVHHEFGETFRDDLVIGQGEGDLGAGRPFVHVAYHSWRHYSSVRNTAGPATGKPNVNDPDLAVLSEAEEEQARRAVEVAADAAMGEGTVVAGVDQASVQDTPTLEKETGVAGSDAPVQDTSRPYTPEPEDIRVLKNAAGEYVDTPSAKRALRLARGDVAAAVASILDGSEASGASDGSASVLRETDDEDDDEDVVRPKRRRGSGDEAFRRELAPLSVS